MHETSAHHAFSLIMHLGQSGKLEPKAHSWRIARGAAGPVRVESARRPPAPIIAMIEEAIGTVSVVVGARRLTPPPMRSCQQFDRFRFESDMYLLAT